MYVWHWNSVAKQPVHPTWALSKRVNHAITFCARSNVSLFIHAIKITMLNYSNFNLTSTFLCVLAVIIISDSGAEEKLENKSLERRAMSNSGQRKLNWNERVSAVRRQPAFLKISFCSAHVDEGDSSRWLTWVVSFF